MPKIIKNLKEIIISKSKIALNENGFDNFTVRAIAKECGIAVGTVYNYFPSKENLIANVMLDDWQSELENIKKKTERSFNCTISLKVIFGYLCNYRNSYKSTWNDFAATADTETELQKIIKSGISELIHSALLYFGANMSPDPTGFLTEILVFEASKDSAAFDEIEPFITRIIKL